MFDLYLISNSRIVQNFKQLFSLIYVKCGIFSLSFTSVVDCVLNITGTGMLLFLLEGVLIRN